MERADRRESGLCIFLVEGGKRLNNWPVVAVQPPDARADPSFVVTGCTPSVQASTLPELLSAFAASRAERAKYFITPRLLAEGLPQDANAGLLRCSDELFSAQTILDRSTVEEAIYC